MLGEQSYTEAKHIYKAINAIQGELAKIGISKGRKNKEQGYSFRGIDDVYGALAPLLAKYEVCVFPHVQERIVHERTTAKGTVLFYTTLKVEYELVSAQDGSIQTCSAYGEAMDTADKSTNKAMSAAYKYMCLQVFCIPTEGENDADERTHDDIVAEQKSSVEEIVAGIQEKMTLENAKAFFARAVKQYGDGTPEFETWVRVWRAKNKELEQAKTNADLEADAEYINSI